MDSILTSKAFFALEEEEPDYEVAEKVSLWVVDNEYITPSTTLKVLTKLIPGIYKVGINSNYGMFCKKVDISSDELFNFSDSIIPSLIQEISLFWDKADLYKQNKLVHKRGILLCGYPGCGKTSIISLLCDELIKRKGIVFIVDDANNLGVYTTFIKNNFRQIEPDTPIITVIEELDTYGLNDTILDFLDGKSQIDHHLLLTTSNNTVHIPDAYLRPSRIDLKIELPLPSITIREEYFLNKKLTPEIAKELAIKTDEFSLAELKELYIAIYILDYSLEESLIKIKTPHIKKDFSSKKLKHNKLGI